MVSKKALKKILAKGRIDLTANKSKQYLIQFYSIIQYNTQCN